MERSEIARRFNLWARTRLKDRTLQMSPAKPKNAEINAQIREIASRDRTVEPIQTLFPRPERDEDLLSSDYWERALERMKPRDQAQ